MVSPFFSLLHDVDAHLRVFVFYLSASIAVSIFILLVTGLVRLQKTKFNFGIELVWAVVPFVMLFVMMVPVANIFIYQQQKPAALINALVGNSKI